MRSVSSSSGRAEEGQVKYSKGDVSSSHYCIVEVCCVNVPVNLTRFPPVKADGQGFYHCASRGTCVKILSFDPFDVVEATMEIAALIIGWPFVSEEGPDRRIAVEVKDEVRPQPLEEGSLLSPF
jgi:hypothetical protein